MKTCYLVTSYDDDYLMASCNMDIIYHTLYEWCTNDAYIDFCYEVNEGVIEGETIEETARRCWEDNMIHYACSFFIAEVPFYD